MIQMRPFGRVINCPSLPGTVLVLALESPLAWETLVPGKLGILVTLASFIKRHYSKMVKLLQLFDSYLEFCKIWSII